MNRNILLFAFFFIPCFYLNAEDTTPSTTPKEGYYILTYKNYGVNLELTANGYQVREGDSDEDSSGQADINYWIVPNKNSIRIRLTERKKNKKEKLELEPEAEVKLVIGQKGQFPEEGLPVLNFNWNKDSTIKPNGEWTELTFEPPFYPPTKLWSLAEPIELTPEKEKSVIQFAKEFTKALNSKDPKKIFPYIEFRARDTSEVRYYPYEKKDELKSLNGMIKVIGSTWKLDDKNLKFQLLGENKILHITNRKGDPIISSKKGASLPLYLSNIQGKWEIVR